MSAPSDFPAARRIKWVARFGALWVLIVLGRLVHVQVIRHEFYLKKAEDQQIVKEEVQALRGTIYGSNGRILATSTEAASVYVHPLQIPKEHVAFSAEVMGRALDLDIQQLQQKLQQTRDKKHGFVWIKRRVTHEQYERLRSFNLRWVHFVFEGQRRHYPNGMLGASVVGVVQNHPRPPDRAGENSGANSNRPQEKLHHRIEYIEDGVAGLELRLDRELRGQPGVIFTLTDGKRRGIESFPNSPAVPGTNFGLTIHESIQAVADRELLKAVREEGAEAGMLVAMEPHTGRVLAISNIQRRPAGSNASESEFGFRSNLAILAPYEIGSVAKIITFAAALETTSLTVDSTFSSNGSIARKGRVISDERAYGTLSLQDCFVKSSNVCTVQVAERVGLKNLGEYYNRFGLGARTGVGLPGENSGDLRAFVQPDGMTLDSASIGYGVSATTLQLALAGSVIATGGLRPKPNLVLWRQAPGQARQWVTPPAPERVLRPETAHALNRMMEQVVLRGTATRARLDGYYSSGKTGTAKLKIPGVKGYSDLYTASFVGFAPAANPTLVIAVSLRGVRKFGGIAAAPVFRAVANDSLRLLGVQPEMTAQAPAIAEAHRTPPQQPSPAAVQGPADATEQVAVTVSSGGFVVGPTAPDFVGKSLRSVLNEALRRGVRVEYEGRGIARSQWPEPGAALDANGSILVRFGP